MGVITTRRAPAKRREFAPAVREVDDRARKSARRCAAELCCPHPTARPALEARRPRSRSQGDRRPSPRASTSACPRSSTTARTHPRRAASSRRRGVPRRNARRIRAPVPRTIAATPERRCRRRQSTSPRSGTARARTATARSSVSKSLARASRPTLTSVNPALLTIVCSARHAGDCAPLRIVTTLCATGRAPAAKLRRAASQTATTRSQRTAAVIQNFSSGRSRNGTGPMPWRVLTMARAPASRAPRRRRTVADLLWQWTTQAEIAATPETVSRPIGAPLADACTYTGMPFRRSSAASDPADRRGNAPRRGVLRQRATGTAWRQPFPRRRLRGCR